MKSTIILAVALIFATPLYTIAQEKAGKKDTTVHQVLYTCPMHPDIKMFKAGKCPTCGMKLEVSTKETMKRDVTKSYSCPVHADITSEKAGVCPKCGTKMTLTAKEKMKADVVKLYTCPMHPNETSDKPGKCPKCGMELSKAN